MSSEELEAAKARFADWKATQQIDQIGQLHAVFAKWLYMKPEDHEALEVVLSGALDRKVAGDPSWFYLIGAPASSKTELINSTNQLTCTYPLDTLTPSTFISGLTKNNKETGEPEPVGGLLKKMDGKAVMIKDLTTLLNSPAEKRDELYGQLRSIYDGKLEKGFGTLPDPIRVNARIGLVCGVTPIIDKYSALQNALGERFLKIRLNPSPLDAAKRALRNEGKEDQIRQELQNAVKAYVERLDFTHPPDVPSDYADEVLAMGMYVATMRANVWKQYDENRNVKDFDLLYTEVPTRVCKQLKHTSKILAVLRKHEEIGEAELATLARIVRDTADQKKQGIIKVWATLGWDLHLDPPRIAALTSGLYRQTAALHLEVLEALGAVCTDADGLYYLGDDFKEYAKIVMRDKGDQNIQRTLGGNFVTKEAQKTPRLEKCSRCFRPLGEERALIDGFEYCPDCRAEIVKDKLAKERAP